MAKKNDLKKDTEYNEFDDYESDYYTGEATASEEDAITFAEEKPREKFAGLRTLSVLFSILAIGGLFIGLLAKWISAIAPLAIAGTGKLANSMLGLIIEGFKRLGGAPYADYGLASAPYYASVLPIAKIVPYLALILALGVLVSVICTVAIFVVKRATTGRKLLLINGYVVFFVYAAYFIMTFTVRLLCGYTSYLDVIDVPTAIIAGISLLILFGFAISERKKAALLNFLLLLLVLFAGFGFLYRESPTLTDLRNSFSMGHTGRSLVVQIFVLFLAIVLVFNFIAAVFRLGAKKGFKFITVCYGLQFVLALVLACIYVFMPADGGSTNWSVLGELSMLVLLIASFAVFLVALLFVILFAVNAKKAHAVETQPEVAANAIPAEPTPVNEKQEEDDQSEEEDDYIDFDDYEEDDDYEYEYEPDFMPPQMAYVAPPPPPQPAPQPEPQPAPPPQPEPQPAPQPQPVPQPVPQQPIQQAPNIVILREKEKPAPPPPQPEPPAPMSEFEIKMAEYARHGVAKPASAEQPQQPERRAERRPMPPPQPRRQTPPQQNNAPAGESVYEDGQYTYDAFFHTLTPKQKSEFGDLFISNKYGTHNYLPVYVIGGDNRAFFSKVFIYLGRFRETISAGLLEKMYQYVNTKK